MKRSLLSLMPVLGAILLAACSSSGGSSTFALVGVPTQNSHMDSANFLISGKQCNYYTYRGDGGTPPEAAKGCTLMEDKPNSVGHPHMFVKIGFATAKGEQVLTLRQSGDNSLSAKSIPNVGMYLPTNWTVTTPAADTILNSSAAGSTYSSLAVHIDGVRCSLTITPVSDNKPVSEPCGLMYWGGSSISIAIPGSLISSAYARQSKTLHFTQNSEKPGAWNLVKPPDGFPAAFSEAAPAAK